MKKILCILMILIMIFSFTGCQNNSNETKSYQKLTYTDFNNMAVDKGYTVLENTDNSALEFEKSFYFKTESGLNLFFFQTETIDVAYTYFNYVFQSYETYLSDFSYMQKQDNYGIYVTTDDNLTVYISFVDNTLLYSIFITETEEEADKLKDELKEYLDYLEYPSIEFFKK